MYTQVFGQMKKLLGQLDKWLDAAIVHAKTNGTDPASFLELRLAPDQFAFARQVQIACDTLKLAAVRLTGKEAPSFADDETSLDELRVRIAKTLAFLDTVTDADWAGAATAVVSQPRWEGKTMTGADYFVEHAVPNFFFHATHVYALLRHAGVPLGKKDYLGALTMKPAPASP